MSPWFHAKLWLVRAGMKAQSAGVGQLPPPVAKKNQSGSANGVNVGFRNWSADIMWSVFISVRSARATMMFCWSTPVYGFSQWSWAISRSRFPRHQVRLGRVARDVDVGRVVRVDREARRVAELCPDHAPQVGVDLAHAVVVAGDVDAVAALRSRLGGHQGGALAD